MALMGFREANQVLWRGVRPAHDGTQITKGNAQTGAGAVVIYTGHATKTLFITFASLASRLDVAGAARVLIEVMPVGEPGVVPILSQYYDIAGHQCMAATFNPPIEVAATEDISLVVWGANIDARACIHGWVE